MKVGYTYVEHLLFLEIILILNQLSINTLFYYNNECIVIVMLHYMLFYFIYLFLESTCFI